MQVVMRCSIWLSPELARIPWCAGHSRSGRGLSEWAQRASSAGLGV